MLHQSLDLVSNKHLIAFFMNAENWMFLMFFRYKILLKIDTMHINTKINSYMKPWKRQKCLIHQRPESPFADVDECTSGLHSCHIAAHCSYCRHEIPSDTLNCLFPSNIPSKDIQFFPNLPASKNWPEEQIFWVTGSLGAPDHVNIWDWDKVNRIPSVVKYRTVFSFHLAKRINPPDPGWDRNERYCPLFGNRLLGVKLIKREQNSRWTFTQAKTSSISGVKTGSMLVCRPCDCTSGSLNKTSVREKPRGVYLKTGCVFPSYLMIFRYVERD